MSPRAPNPKSARTTGARLVALACAMLLLPGEGGLLAQTEPAPAAAVQPEAEAPAARIPPEQLDSLVAPIALYPDPLLSQALVASTYPLEIVQLQQWLIRNKDLTGKALTDAAMKQPWDASIQAMAVLPDVVKRLADDIQWTTDLGNAFLAQQSDVMDAVQRMRKKAQDSGALKTSEQQKVETKVVESKTVIVVQPASTEVVYVPSYNPTVVYGPPVYPYPPVYYPPVGAYAATAAISFGVGMAVGAAWGGHYGWGAGWGHNDIDIDVDNNFNRNANVNRNTNVNRTGNVSGNRSGTWQHNPQHRGGAPYANSATANRYGGQARGASATSRQAGAQQQLNRQGGNLSTASRSGGAAGQRSAGGSGVSQRSTYGGASSRSGGNNVGSRSVPSSSGGGSRSAFSGGSGGYSGSSARASSSRGSSSMGSRSSGSRGGGSRGGGGRGGGRR